MTTMKAIRLSEYGPASVLRYEDAPRPEAGPGEVLVRVSAAGVNPIDWKFRAGYLQQMIPVSLPWIPGFDFSGMVEETGSGVTSFAVGDALFGKSGFPGGGSYAEFVAVSAADAVRKPPSISHVQAAAIPAGALTAWQAFFDEGTLELQAGQTVLILGAAGGVGGFAIQLAKWKGARVVAAGRTASEAHVRSLGADDFIDTARGDLSPAGEVDAVLDLVGGVLQESAWPLLRRGGAFVSTLSPPADHEAAARGARASLVSTQTSARQMEEIAGLVERGVMKVDVTRTFPLDQAGQAQTYLEGGGVVGKLVLTV